MEFILLQVLFFLLTAGFLIWREYHASKHARHLAQKIAGQRRRLDSISASIAKQSEHSAALAASFAALKEHAENTREFAESSSVSLDKLVREFEIVVSYRKELSRNYDGVEGL